MIPRRERLRDTNLTTVPPLRASSATPRPDARSPQYARTRAARNSSPHALERHPDRRRGPEQKATAMWPPGSSTRASSSKNGIMLFSVTRSNAPSGNGRSDASAEYSARGRRREPLGLGDHSRARRRRRSPPRPGSARASEPRDRAAAGAEIEDARRRRRERVERRGDRQQAARGLTRVVSHSGARRSKLCVMRPRKSRQRRARGRRAS